MKKLPVYCAMLLWMVACLWPPQSAVSADKRLISSVAEEYANGSDTRIIEAIAKKLGLPLEIYYSPFKRRLHLLKNGDLDLLPGLLRTSERETYIHFLDPPYKQRSDTVFIVNQGKAGMIRQYEDLRKLRIGIITGSKYFPRFDNDSQLTLEPCANSESNLKKVLAGRIDTAVLPESVGIDLVDRMGIKGQVEAAEFRYVGEKRVYIGISKKSRLMDSLETVAGTIRSMIESGELRQVIVKHYTDRGLPVPAM